MPLALALALALAGGWPWLLATLALPSCWLSSVVGMLDVRTTSTSCTAPPAPARGGTTLSKYWVYYMNAIDQVSGRRRAVTVSRGRARAARARLSPCTRGANFLASFIAMQWLISVGGATLDVLMVCLGVLGCVRGGGRDLRTGAPDVRVRVTVSERVSARGRLRVCVCWGSFE